VIQLKVGFLSQASTHALNRENQTAAKNFLQQQARFDDFIEGYDNERPHQALNMQCPAQRYQPSSRPYRGLPDIDYPLHDKAATVTTGGRICFNNQKIQSKSGVRRPDRRHQANRRPHLARLLYGL
jgi:hypothetical protein